MKGAVALGVGYGVQVVPEASIRNKLHPYRTKSRCKYEPRRSKPYKRLT
jgi:hypothetical protein